jgi:anti-sigma factor RsiW
MSEDPSHSQSVALEEQLSAYLDGELEEEGVRQVERMLASDPKVRETLQRMERTWEVLDELQDVEVDEHFTQSTLEMVAVAAESDVQRLQEEAPKRRRRMWLVAGTTLVGAAAAGFAAVALFWPNSNKKLIEDLPVLEHLDQYRQVRDFEFLEALRREGLFAEEDGDAE